MKVKTNVQKPEFEPVTVETTFETQDELSLFTQMLCYNVSVPRVVTSNRNKQEKLCDMLSEMRKVIEKEIDAK